MFLLASTFTGDASSEEASRQEANVQELVTIIDASKLQDLGGNLFEAGIVRFHTYTPKVSKVTPGTTVVWLNQDIVEHQVHVFKEGDDGLTSLIVSELIFPGKKFAVTFHEEGYYRYICDCHPYMRGHVDVKNDY